MIKALWRSFTIILIVMSVIVVGVIGLTSEVFWKTLYPLSYRDEVWQQATDLNIDPHLVMAIMRTESRFLPRAVSKSGALGLMQIMPQTAQEIASMKDLNYQSEEDLYEPLTNITVGLHYLDYLLKTFHGDLVLGLASYNGGIGNVERWISTGVWSGRIEDISHIPFKETRNYVSKVLNTYEIYCRLYK